MGKSGLLSSNSVLHVLMVVFHSFGAVLEEDYFEMILQQALGSATR